jgi:hypothetical protein
VYDHVVWLGTLREVDRKFIAISALDGRDLGTFDDVTAAADAIDAYYGDRP